MIRSAFRWGTMVLAAGGLLAAGCDKTPYVESPAGVPGKPQAMAELSPAEGYAAVGKVELHQTDEGIIVTARLENVQEPGKHGFHIHEKGDCGDIAEMSMGGHLAPTGYAHALPSETQDRHLGDLGNILVEPDGTAWLKITVPGANLKEDDPNSFLDKAVVLHAGEDKGQAEQPTGGAGDPIACGVIEEVED